jgi:hypothetical protein
LLNVVPLPANWREDEEAALTRAFEALDNHPWAPPEQRPSDELWTDYEAREAAARAHVAAALIGGRDVGHSRDTIPEGTAHAFWTRFRDLFLADARFFLGVGLGDPAYVHLQGVVAVDDDKAGCLCVVEGD